mmetsp:Transcript_127627/g.254992  ORF Transcript_127627/g.254992 Transcript_127627/m.254992 type:complete len:171 (+) Transcript_127627:56-568(+)|eukprot:CAMPEP_0172682374 /NCGR_PEP_ID=MMETSP1074-20121228/18129_1 /TAXON_ID=2916 /ORGANISM="Ceratium fusus, Strain PA161109" /LENGTH=170 /DNA_ID=CAMNT_0013501049 /DNA_START=51 /DNA_END=563 /DNA_ORIENTATION=+
MPNPYMSLGFMPGQTAMTSVSQDDLRKLMYKTSYRHGTPGRVMSAEAKWTNLKDVYGPSQRDYACKMDLRHLKHRKSSTEDREAKGSMFPAEFAKAAEIVLAKPNLTLPDTWDVGNYRTCYNRDFGSSMRRNASAPQIGGKSWPQAPPDMLPHDHPCFRTRRAPTFSPGQ